MRKMKAKTITPVDGRKEINDIVRPTFLKYIYIHPVYKIIAGER